VPLAATAVGVVEPARAGMASGINTTFRQVGTATGVAVLGTVIAGHANVIDGLNVILLVGAGIAVTAALATFFLIRERDFVDAESDEAPTAAERAPVAA